MPTSSTDPLPRALTAEYDGLRRLALALARDRDRADDAVQTAFVTALVRGPDEPRAARGWLRVVLANVLRQDTRSRVRRRDRERRAGVDVAGRCAPAAADVAERLEAERRLVDALRALEEPYRTAVVLRYYDGLPPRVIAERVRAPVKTVHSRIDRGIARLRAHLVRGSGDDRVRNGLAVPWTGSGPSLLVPSTAGVLLMSTKLKVVAAATVMIVAASLVVSTFRDSARTEIERGGPERTEPVVEGRDDARPDVVRELEVATSNGSPTTAAARAAPSAAGRLTVRVVKAGTSEPVEGAAIRVEPIGVDGRRRTRPSDAAGSASFEVQGDVRHRVTVTPGAAARAGGLTDRNVAELEPLRPGEEHVVVVTLRHRLDLVFYGRVVRDEDGAPVERAVVRPRWTAAGDDAAGVPAVETNPVGCFAMPFASWRLCHAQVEHDEYGPALCAFSGVETSPSRPFEVRLARGAALEVHVESGDRERSEFIVRASFPAVDLVQPAGSGVFEGDFDREARPSGPGGIARLLRLPAGVAFDVCLRAGDEVLWQSPERLTLAPGEIRRIDVDVAAGTLAQGRITDERGAPIADCALWAIPVLPRHEDGVERHLDGDDRHAAHRVATSDRDGRFVLGRLAAGEWWIGPAPPSARDESVDADLVPLAARVVIVAYEAERWIEIIGRRGLYIDGSVETPPGLHPSYVGVYAQSRDRLGDVRARAEGESLAFRLGPLAPGSYVVGTWASDAFGISTQVVAKAGQNAVVLRLGFGGAIAGRVVDATDGRPVEAHVHLLMANGSLGASTGSDVPGSFRFVDLNPGRFDLRAATPDGRVAVLEGIELAAGETNGDLLLAVERGGRIAIRYDGGPERLRYRILRGGARLSDSKILRGQTSIDIAPAGPTDVRLYGGEFSETRRVDVVAGELVEVEFRPPPP